MWLATSLGAAEIIPLLTKYGADINSRDHSGDTALNLAAQKWSIGKIFKPLLEAGADPNIANRAGETPLMWAAKINQKPEEILPLLVEHGARLDMKSKGGVRLRDWLTLDLGEKGVLDWARQNKNPRALEIMKKLKAREESKGAATEAGSAPRSQ